MEPDSEPMVRLRSAILDLGGIQAANSYVKINLSLFGLYPRAFVPTVPPELVLLPGHILYEMSSWTRAIVVPLSIVQAVGGTRPAPAGFHLNELAAPVNVGRLQPDRPRSQNVAAPWSARSAAGRRPRSREVDARPYAL